MIAYVTICIRNKIPIFSKHNNIFIGEEETDPMKENAVIKFLTYTIVVLVICLVISIVYEQKENNIVNQTQTIVLGENNTPEYIDINNCSKEEFMSIEGVGELKANEFITKRTELGKFESIYDIKEHNILGEKVFNSIKDKLTIGGI